MAKNELPEGYTQVSLGSSSRTEKDPTTSTTVKEDSQTQRLERTVNAFMNPDGTVNEAAVKDFNTNQRDPLAKAYGIDPTSGKYIGSVADLLGFDPKIREAEEKKKEELARFKQKEAGWRSALGVIGDVVTAAHGGNVWTRQNDGVAAKAKEEGDAAHEAVMKIANAVPAAKRAAEQQYEAAVQKRLQQYIKDNSQKVSTSITSGGGSQTYTEGGGSRTYGSRQAVVGRGTGSGSGSGSGTNRDTSFVVTVNNKDPKKATHQTYQLSKDQYENISNILLRRYNTLINDEDENKANAYMEAFMNSGILTVDSNGKKVWNTDLIMRGGSFWGITEADEKKINEYTGGQKIRFRIPERSGNNNNGDDAPWVNSTEADGTSNGNVNKAPYLN